MMQKNFDFSLYDPKNDGSNKEAMEKLLKEDQNQYQQKQADEAVKKEA